MLRLLLLASSTYVFVTASQHGENPIRKVVTMLQDMQNTVVAEGKKEEALFKKFMCYCKTSGDTLVASIADAKAKIEAMSAAIKEAAEKKKQTEADLKEHQESRAEAKEAIAQATALRQKEAKDFAQFASDSTTNLSALTAAIAALEKGMGGAFLQTNAANIVRRFAMEKAQMADETRQELLSFLSGSQPAAGYIPQSHEIVGILKQMKDTMGKDLQEATDEENAAKQAFEALMSAKRKEVATLTKQIESELKRIGELDVLLANSENDIEETQESLAADKKFLEELKKGCDKKAGEWEVMKKTRAQELLALAETIKVLNDDDALELFKKTLPSASASFLQVQVSAKEMRSRALAALRAGRKATKGALAAQPALDLIEMALNGKQMGFEKVIAMIDEMVENLKKEQGEDDSKKEYCLTQIDQTEDKQKVEEQSIADSEAAIENMDEAIATLVSEIKALEAGIAALDKSVAEATALRKEEHAAYKELMSDDTTAKEVLLWAKNRLYKFYDPKLYKPPPARDLSESETIVENFGGVVPTAPPSGIAGTGIGLSQVAPPPPPETFGPYTKKTEESHGVVEMIDILVKDLDKEMQEATVEEKDAQKEYQVMMAESAEKRAQDSASITQKNSAKAETEEAREAEKETKADTTKELMLTVDNLKNLHMECDWLLKYYDVRKTARTSEIESLIRARAVLSGADYSLLQESRKVREHKFLRA